MVVRAPRENGTRTRQAILLAAAALSTVEGLEGLSIGDLATSLGMSKSGVYAHFGSKQELQLATVDEAARIFEAEVMAAATTAPPGVPQLVAVCEGFFEHLRRRRFPGGCFFAGASLEMGTRPGPVKDAVAAFQAGLVRRIQEFAEQAIALEQLPPEEDPAALAFELNGILLAANVAHILHGNEHALDLARGVVHRRLGTPAS